MTERASPISQSSVMPPDQVRQLRMLRARTDAALDELEAACDDVRRTVHGFFDALEDGEPAGPRYHDGTLGPRDRFYAAVERAEAAINDNRAWSVRLMHDNEGRSFHEIAGLMRRSRQFIARLYKRPLEW
jgi:hypothetical protein